MSSPMGQYGALNYQSPEVRALGGITPTSYDYRDQGKTISKLVGDVSYMANMQRKMQKGIDDANQNVIQQIQGLLNEFLVIFGGHGDTGFDFGDLKYILQAIGAMFGLEPGGVFPVNLFEAAWNFFSNYLLPFGNFEEAINTLIDNLIATVLDMFGEIPIIGEALQQLAAILSTTRDGVLGIKDDIEEFFDNLFAFFNLETSTSGSKTLGDVIAAGQDFVNRLLGIETDSTSALTAENPAIAAIDGRIAVLESALGSWSDNLNRTSIGSNYNVISGGSHIDMDGKILRSSGAGSPRIAMLYSDETFLTAKNYAQWTLKFPFGLTGDCVLVSMSDTSMGNFVGVKVTVGPLGIGSGGQIISGSSTSSFTNQGTHFSRQWKNGDVVGIGYDPATEQYICYVNNNPVDNWTDTGAAVVDISSTNRSAGMILASNNVNYGPAVDEWAAYDWA